MRKLLATFVALCMSLTMLHATALAAVPTYKEADVAMYITEDTTLSENVAGLVVVTAPVTVTVTGASLPAGLVIAPDAEGAIVTVTENSSLGSVIILAKATVNIEATVENLTVAAPNAAVAIAGTVANVTVEEEAAGASLTVAPTATVSTLAVAAPNVKADVSGTVATVTVAETAANAELVVNEGASVAEVTDATGGLTVSGAAAGTVTPTVPAPAPSTGNSTSVGSGSSSGGSNTPGTDDPEPEKPVEANIGIVAAPLVDHNGTDDGAPTQDKTNNLATEYGVTTVEINKSSTTSNQKEYKVTLAATTLVKHKNGGNTDGWWIGFGIPQTNNKANYYVINVSKADADKEVVINGDNVTIGNTSATLSGNEKEPTSTFKGSDYTGSTKVDKDTTYDVFYFGGVTTSATNGTEAKEALDNAAYIVVKVETSTTTSGDGTKAADGEQTGTTTPGTTGTPAAGETTTDTTIFHVSFEIENCTDKSSTTTPPASGGDNEQGSGGTQTGGGSDKDPADGGSTTTPPTTGGDNTGDNKDGDTENNPTTDPSNPSQGGGDNTDDNKEDNSGNTGNSGSEGGNTSGGSTGSEGTEPGGTGSGSDSGTSDGGNAGSGSSSGTSEPSGTGSSSGSGTSDGGNAGSGSDGGSSDNGNTNA